jgi:recombination protein RecA
MVKKSKEVDVKEIEVDTDSTLAIAMRAVEKKHPAAVKWLRDVPIDGYDFVSTGSVGMDYALGGGFVCGRIVEISGHPGCGKSTLAISTIAEANKSGIKALYVDAERALDPKLPRLYGVNPDLFLLEDAPVSVEEHFEIIEDVIHSGGVGICVLDSVTALITMAEMEADTSKEFMGKIPKFLSEKIRRLIQLLGETNTLFIFINQIRNKLGGYGNPETTTGGMAIPFYSTHRVSVSGGSSKSTRLLGEDGSVIGHKMSYTIIKNKIGAPFRTGEIDLIYGKGFDIVGELIDLGLSLGIVDQGGAWFTYDGMRAQGKETFKEMLIEKKDTFKKLSLGIKDVLGMK